MRPPEIGNSTEEERRQYIKNTFRCIADCDMCGLCTVFHGKDPEDAYELLESIATISGTKDKLKKVKTVPAKKQKTKRPPVNFFKCNIPVGAELVFSDDPSVVVVVVDERKVQYKDEITSLSAISDRIKGYSTSGPSLFTYKGKTISQIAEETQWKDA